LRRSRLALSLCARLDTRTLSWLPIEQVDTTRVLHEPGVVPQKSQRRSSTNRISPAARQVHPGPAVAPSSQSTPRRELPSPEDVSVARHLALRLQLSGHVIQVKKRRWGKGFTDQFASPVFVDSPKVWYRLHTSQPVAPGQTTNSSWYSTPSSAFRDPAVVVAERWQVGNTRSVRSTQKHRSVKRAQVAPLEI
jgi:hypothetical protein